MWERQEVDALVAGMTYEQYWNSYPNEVNAYIKAFEKKRNLELADRDLTNHVLGHYISLAFNSPKKYPKKPLMKQQTAKAIETKEEKINRIANMFQNLKP